MDARQHHDLIFTISQAILDARYAPPKRRRSAWGEGYNEDLEQARRVAAAIVEALRRSGFQISRKPPAPHHSTPKATHHLAAARGIHLHDHHLRRRAVSGCAGGR